MVANGLVSMYTRATLWFGASSHKESVRPAMS